LKILSSLALAVLFFVVAIAGLSPPPAQKGNQMVAASAHITPQADFQQTEVATEVAFHHMNKKIVTEPVAVLTETNAGKNEVAARARNGSQSRRRAEPDVGMVLLL
jgi:hypothetical protein